MDSSSIDRLVEEVIDLRRRVHALETAPRVGYTSARGAGTRWYPESGNLPYLYIGDLAGDGEVGLWIVDGDGNYKLFIGTVNGDAAAIVYSPGGQAQLHVDDGEMIAPRLPAAWVRGTNVTADASGRPTTTSATYVELWRSLVWCGRASLNTYIDVYNAASTSSVKIVATEFGTAHADVTVVEQTGLTGTALVFGPWTVPNIGGSSPMGRLLDVRIHARRTAGGDAIAVAPRIPVIA